MTYVSRPYTKSPLAWASYLITTPWSKSWVELLERVDAAFTPGPKKDRNIEQLKESTLKTHLGEFQDETYKRETGKDIAERLTP